MAERESHINWTKHTWNPWQGCKHISPGCANCYMFRDKRRYGQDPQRVHRSTNFTFNKPLRIEDPGLIFPCSWSDWFIRDADEWRGEAWEVVRRTRHTYQILTKRHGRILRCLPGDWGEGYRNVWLGVSVEDQEHLRRAETLAQVPAAVRFISYEPALGPVSWGDVLEHIDWLIIGGESGPGARPFDLDWARTTIEQCQAAGTAVWFKQVGALTNYGGEPFRVSRRQLQEAVPEDLQIRQWPVGWEGHRRLEVPAGQQMSLGVMP